MSNIISNNSKKKNTDSNIIKPLEDYYSLASNDTIFIPDLEVEFQIKKFFPLINLKNTYFGFQFIKPKIAKLSIELYSSNSYPQKNLLKGIINEYGLFKQNVDKQIALFYYYKSAFEDKEPLAFYYLYQLNLFDKIGEYSFNLNSLTEDNDKDKDKNEIYYSDSLLNDDFCNNKDTPYSSLIISNISKDDVIKEISKFPLCRNRDLEILFLICSIVYLPPSFTYISNEGDYKGINPKHTIALHLDLEDKYVEKMSKLISKIWNNWGNSNNSNNNSSVDYKNNFFVNLPFSEQDLFFIKSVFEFTFNKPGSDYYNKVPYIYQDNIINITNIPYTLKHSESQEIIIKEIHFSPDHQKNAIQDHLFYIYYQKLEYLAKVHSHDYSLGHLGFVNSSLFLPNINNTDIPLTYFISDKAHPPNNNYKIAINYFNKLRENSTNNSNNNSNINSQLAYKFFLPYEIFLYSNINDTISVKKLAKESNNYHHPKSHYILFDIIMLEIQKSFVFENIIKQTEELTILLINDIIEGGIYSVFEVINLKYLMNKYFNFSLSCSLDVEEELISLLTFKYHGKVNWSLYNPCDDEKAEFNFSLGQALYLKYKKECSDVINDVNEIEIKERELNDEIERELCLKEAQLSIINSNIWCGCSNDNDCYRSSRLNKINNTLEIKSDINSHERIDIKDRIRSGSADIHKKFISYNHHDNVNINHDDSIFTLNNVSNNKSQLKRISSYKLNKSISLSNKHNKNYENNIPQNNNNNNSIKDLIIINNANINNANDCSQFNIDNNINQLRDLSTNKTNQLTPQSNFCDYSFREANNKDNYKKGQSNKSNFNIKNDINNNSNTNLIVYKKSPLISGNMRKSITNNSVNSKEDEDLGIFNIKDNKKYNDNKENNKIKEYMNKSDKKESDSRGLFRKFSNAQDNDFDLYSANQNPFNIENLKNNEINDSSDITNSFNNNNYDDVYKISNSILNTVNKAKKNNIFSFGQVKAKDYSSNIKNNDDNNPHSNTNLNEFSLSNNHTNSYNLFTSSTNNNNNNIIKEENNHNNTTFNRIFNRQFTNKTDLSIRSHYIKKSEYHNIDINANNTNNTNNTANTANNANTVNFNNDTNINSNTNREQLNNLFNFNNNISSISRTINKRSIINSLISSKKSINSHSNTNKSNSNIFFNSNNNINNRSLNIINETDNNLFNFELETNTPYYTDKKINNNNTNINEDSDDNRDALVNNNINNLNNNLSNIVKADSITSNLCLDNNNESDHELSNNENNAVRNRLDSMTDINNLIDMENSDFEETNEENVSSESSRFHDNYSSQSSNSSSNYNIYINNNNNDSDSEIEGVSNKRYINDYKTIIFNEEKDFNIDYKEENNENNENKDNDFNISEKITKLAVIVKQVNSHYNSKTSKNKIKNDKNIYCIPTIQKNNDSDNINNIVTNTCNINIKNNSTTSNILNTCNINNISDSNKIANKNSSTLGIKNFLSSKQITTIKSAQMSSMLLNQQTILNSNNNNHNNDNNNNNNNNNNNSISSSSPYLLDQIAKLNQLTQRKKVLFNLKKTITTKLNFCITLFNKANQTTKNNNYRRYVLACILKTYLKIEALKPKTSGTQKKIATMKREVTSTLKHVFEESVKQTPLKFLSSSFYYQLGKNYLGDHKIETALSYLQLGKLSFNKSLGYGSILSYFRKFKLEKLMSSYEEYLGIKKEVSEIKTNKGIKNCYDCSNNINCVRVKKHIKEEIGDNMSIISTKIIDENINNSNDNEHYKAFNDVVICKKSINEYFIYHRDFVNHYNKINADLINDKGNGEEKDNNNNNNKEKKLSNSKLNSPLKLTKQSNSLNTNNDNLIKDNYTKASNPTTTTTTEICDICFEEPKQIVFYPCKHAVCCLNCTYKIIYNKSCPLCRQGISLFL